MSTGLTTQPAARNGTSRVAMPSARAYPERRTLPMMGDPQYRGMLHAENLTKREILKMCDKLDVRFLRRELDWNRGEAFEVMLAIDQYLDEVIGASLRGFVEAKERTSGADTEAGDG